MQLFVLTKSCRNTSTGVHTPASVAAYVRAETAFASLMFCLEGGASLGSAWRDADVSGKSGRFTVSSVG